MDGPFPQLNEHSNAEIVSDILLVFLQVVDDNPY